MDKEIEDQEDGLEIEIVDDTPEEDRGRELLPDDAEVKTPSDEEIEEYSESVQKRIKELTFQFHDQRRKAELAKRELSASTDFAKQLMENNKQISEELEAWKKTVADGENVLIEQAKGRVDSDLERAKAAYKDAFDTGDPERLAEIQAQIAKAAAEKAQIEAYRPQEYVPQEYTAPELPQVEEGVTVPEPDPRAQKWQEANREWFNRDSEMTGYAFGLHQKLIVEQGIDPNSDEYYEKIDEGMRKVFPEKFDDGRQEQEDEKPVRKSGTIVAPVQRSGQSKRKIRLTESQKSLARRLGLTLEQYAEEFTRINRSE